MSKITVIRDPQIKQSKIMTRLEFSNSNETGDPSYDENRVQLMDQSTMTGICYPLIAINNIVIKWDYIRSFELNGMKELPEISFSFVDLDNRFTYLCRADKENEIRLQILPPYDNAYKKINLTFFASSISQGANNVYYVQGIYKLPGLINKQFKCLGRKSTFDLLDLISTETKLGYASDIRSTDDERMIYCNHMSYKDIIRREMGRAIADEKQVYSCWVDFWNYINLCNIYDRINVKDTAEDMCIWVSPNRDMMTQKETPKPVRVPAILSNGPMMEHSELYVNNYDVNQEPMNQYERGNTCIYSVYEENKHEYIDHVIMDDSGVKDDATMSYEYLGEVYGDYNYKLAEVASKFYKQKIQTETIDVHMQYPALGLCRGRQVRFLWYDNDSQIASLIKGMQKASLLKELSQYNLGWIYDAIPWDKNQSGTESIFPNLMYCGQYTIIGITIRYTPSTWDYIVRLVRPDNDKFMFSELEKINQSNRTDV